MMQRGDWVVPYFNAEVRTHKPVLLYWFMIAAYSIFGVNEFSARFWSAALSVLTVLMTYSLGRRLLGKMAGLMAGVCLSTMLMFVVASRAATPDSVLIFFITAALTLYAWGTPAFGPTLTYSLRYPWIRLQNENKTVESGNATLGFPSNKLTLVLMFTMMGFASLDKGPIGFLLPCAVIGMFLLIYRLPASQTSHTSTETDLADQPRHGLLRASIGILNPLHFLKTCLSMRLGWLITVVLAVALPWYIWVTIRSDGVWTRGFFLEHNLGRAMNEMEGHGGTPFYYVIGFLMGTFPWSIFFLPMLLDCVRSLKDPTDSDGSAHAAQHGVRFNAPLCFVACWVCVIVGLFSLASTKLPSYISPCHPAAAMLFGNYLARLMAGKQRSANWWPYASFAVLLLVGIGFGIGTGIVAEQFVDGMKPLTLIGVALVAGAVIAGLLWYRGKSTQSVLSCSVCAFAFSLMLFGWATAHVSKQQQADQLVMIPGQQSDQPAIASLGTLRSSWVFYAGHPIDLLQSSEMEARSFLQSPGDRFLLTSSTNAKRYQLLNDEAIEVVDSVPFFLEGNEDLLLLKRSAATETVASRAETDRR
jgi:4-amino-4-deoxy-L-arabinose transferase-like glycosyltransferase